MRVVGGKWKSRKINQLLKNDHYSIIRPTTDRIRENIFNIIQNLDVKDQIEGANVLDIFCGTGAMGIEAIILRICVVKMKRIFYLQMC